jgi:hypothetical protein
MPASTPAPQTQRDTARAVGLLLIGAGALALVLGALGVGWTAAKMPKVITWSNMIASALELGLGASVMKRKRAAWSFAMSLGGVMTLVNFFGLPQISHAGTSGYVGMGLAVVRLLGVVLLYDSRTDFT